MQEPLYISFPMEDPPYHSPPVLAPAPWFTSFVWTPALRFTSYLTVPAPFTSMQESQPASTPICWWPSPRYRLDPAGMLWHLQIKRRMVFTRFWTIRTSLFQSTVTLDKSPGLHGHWSSPSPWKKTTHLNTKPSFSSTCQSTKMLLNGTTTGYRYPVWSPSRMSRPIGEPPAIFRKITSSTSAIIFELHCSWTTCLKFPV